MINKCKACKKYHCPTCGNTMNDDFYCECCEKQWTGNEEIKPIDIDFFDLYA